MMTFPKLSSLILLYHSNCFQPARTRTKAAALASRCIMHREAVNFLLYKCPMRAATSSSTNPFIAPPGGTFIKIYCWHRLYKHIPYLFPNKEGLSSYSGTTCKRRLYSLCRLGIFQSAKATRELCGILVVYNFLSLCNSSAEIASTDPKQIRPHCFNFMFLAHLS